MHVLLGQVLHRIRHLMGGFLWQESISCPLSLPIPRPNNIRVVKKVIEIVLWLEAEPHIRGLPITGFAEPIGNLHFPLFCFLSKA